MKKTVKKLAAVGLTLTSVMGLVACGTPKKETPTEVEVTKPGNFSVMVDGTVVKETNGGEQFYNYYKEVSGLDITWRRPDHATYYDGVAAAFNSEEDRPDVVLLQTDYETLYAANGFLWDMTDAYNNSQTLKSGRLKEEAAKVMDTLRVAGEDGKIALYGFSPVRGNGCCTYVKESWLKQAGMTKADIAGKQLTFKEYYDMLTKMHTATGKTVISPAGFINASESPYTNYLPEFYQKAQYTFYKNAQGQYADGFSEQAMQDALQRIQTAVKDGILDKESVNNKTSNARDKFYADTTGVFTYWAGSWAETIRQNLASRNLDDSCIALKPIKELGTYIERIPPCWCITTKAENPQGIFKYFIDTMLDGGDIQTAWTYGAKGAHWDTKAETVTVKDDKTAGTTFTEGTFHMLPGIENNKSITAKNFIDPTLSLASYVKADPGAATVSQLQLDVQKMFNENSTIIGVVPMTETLGANITDINIERGSVIARVANGSMTVKEGMDEYNSKVGSLVKDVLAAYNKK